MSEAFHTVADNRYESQWLKSAVLGLHCTGNWYILHNPVCSLWAPNSLIKNCQFIWERDRAMQSTEEYNQPLGHVHSADLAITKWWTKLEFAWERAASISMSHCQQLADNGTHIWLYNMSCTENHNIQMLKQLHLNTSLFSVYFNL